MDEKEGRIEYTLVLSLFGKHIILKNVYCLDF